MEDDEFARIVRGEDPGGDEIQEASGVEMSTEELKQAVIDTLNGSRKWVWADSSFNRWG